MRTSLLLCAVSMLSLMPAFSQKNDEKWFGFAAYPGVRQLCDQVAMEQINVNAMEIHWRSYATSDDAAKVVAFYEKTKAAKQPDSSFRLDKDTDLSIHAATASGYPKCDSKPKSGEKTVIVVSHATRR